MARFLVVVESPAKAKTIGRYLGADYTVRSSLGHVRDLPTGKTRASSSGTPKKAATGTRSRKTRSADGLGVDPDNQWRAHYEVLPTKTKVVAELKTLAKAAETVFLATDMDREGEAIAWHIQEVVGDGADLYRRVIFNEITQKAIQKAFDNPVGLDMNKVNAQQTRRFLDRVVGFKLSPLLWSKISRGLSAGRVQSVAVRLIVEREREISAFVAREYWKIAAQLGLLPSKQTAETDSFQFDLAAREGKKFEIASETEARQIVKELESADFVVAKQEHKLDKSNRPGPPFITSTLQQAASTRLGFGVKRTMSLAQKLYEAGHITYMRTDSTNLSALAVEAARGFILSQFGKEYLPAKPVFYKSKAQAQEAHEAIRPSEVARQSDQLKDMTEEARRLYDLIWRQFVACQMPNALYDLTTVTLNAGNAGRYQLVARGRIQRFDGYMRVKPPAQADKEAQVLPDMPAGTRLSLSSITPTQCFTRPPPRYREASLVQKLEKCGVGRPSTYASIISTIADRGYVSLQGRRFYAEKMGVLVTDRLMESFPNLMDYNFTARLEEQLDRIAGGGLSWIAVLDDFYADFREKLKLAACPDSGMKRNTPVQTSLECSECGRHMLVRMGANGIFLACEGYSLPADDERRCKATLNLEPANDSTASDQDEESELQRLRSKKRCSRCPNAMDAYSVDDKRRLHLCSDTPICSGFEVEEGSFGTDSNKNPSIDCDKCGGQMELRSGRFGKYFKCTNSNCTNTRKLARNGQPAPPKMTPVEMPELACQKVKDYYVLRDGMTGLFLAARGFPKNREIRSPLVKELLPHSNEIDSKYAFLFDAPVSDPEGNPAIIKFSRKIAQHYLSSEKDGKPTAWRAYYQNGQWVEKEASKPAARKRPQSKKKAARRQSA